MARSRKTSPASTGPTRAVAYRRVSTTEQTDSGAGLAAQQSIIGAEVERRGWDLVETFTDEAASGKSLVGREALTAAIAAVESGEADVLVVAKLDRLSRSLLDFAALMERSRRLGWSLVALDLGVDTTTPAGEMVAHLMATFAQYERRIIGQRTREALAAKKVAGVRLGPPRRVPDEVCEQIIGLRAEGLTWQAVADALNDSGVPRAFGGRQWYPSTARNASLAYERDRVAAR